MRSRWCWSLALPLLVLAVAVPALAGESALPPAGVVTITAGSEQLNLWPFTTSNYLPGTAGQSDPVNLVFLYTDPRAIRQKLMTLGGDRPAWSFLPWKTNTGAVVEDDVRTDIRKFRELEFPLAQVGIEHWEEIQDVAAGNATLSGKGVLHVSETSVADAGLARRRRLGRGSECPVDCSSLPLRHPYRGRDPGDGPDGAGSVQLLSSPTMARSWFTA